MKPIWTLLSCCLAACGILLGCQALPEDPAQPAMAPVSSQADSSSAPASPPEAPVPEEPAPSSSEGEPTSSDEEGDWALVLVNADHPMDEDAAPLLAPIAEGSIYQVDERILRPLQDMLSAAQADGVQLLVCSAYRPYSSQKRNFDNSVAAYLAQGYSQEAAVEATARYIAYPGRSEHQTGLALDIVTPGYQSLDSGYAGTQAAQWLLEHAMDYGFTLRYPADKTDVTGISFEPWHYRYVGVETARYLMENGLCLEEYWERLEAGG